MIEMFLFAACTCCLILIAIVDYLIVENKRRKKEIRVLSDVCFQSNKLLNSLLDDHLHKNYPNLIR